MKIKKEMLFFIVTLEKGDNIDKILSQIPGKDIHPSSDNVYRIRNTHLQLFEKVQMRDEQLRMF